MSGLQVTRTVLARDPQREHRINANSFQQDALITFRGWQYAAYYSSPDPDNRNAALRVTVARRHLRPQSGEEVARWQILALDDYEQSTDDGHNTISIGISPGDGTIHLSFDHHCNGLKYRMSRAGAALDARSHPWDKSIFGPVKATLPGAETSPLFKEVSYPRFVSTEEDLLFTFRIGKAGLGSEVLFRYNASNQRFTPAGIPLTGVANNPYPNGFDYRSGRLHVSWCYREFLEYEGVHDRSSTKHMVQAGPNGPENNFGLCYMYSDDYGRRWYNSAGSCIADLDDPELQTVAPSASGIFVFNIPKNSGILNQEAQTVDHAGNFHVLNRENSSDAEKWYIYTRFVSGSWMRTVVLGCDPTETGSRGSLCVDRDDNLYVALPGNSDTSLTVLKGALASEQLSIIPLWTGDGFDGEPLADQGRLETENVLSLFTRTSAGKDGKRDVVVVDIAFP